jgi:cytochrome c oxidase subunit 1
MAMTETRHEAETEPAPSLGSDDAAPRPATGFSGLLGTGRHRSIGRLWVGTALVFLVVSGGVGGALGAERLKTSTYNVFGEKNFAQAMSLHGVSALFLFAIPVFIGLGTIVVPRQVGAKTIAFPRAAATAYWSYLLGGALVIVSYLINGGPFGGNEKGVDLFLVSLAMVIAALVLASVCIATTVLAVRVPGLTLARVPLFAWSMLVATTIWIASLGVLFGLLVLLYIDHRNRVFFYGGNFQIDKWLRWTMTQPQVYAFAIPVLGFAGDVVPVFARVRARMHGVQLAAIGAFAPLSFGAWTFLWVQQKPVHEFLFVVVSLSALLPLLAFAAGLADTVRRGRVRIGSPLLFAVAAVLMLLAGVAAGALRAIHSLQLAGTTTDSAIVHYALGAAAIAAIGAIHFWWPHVLTRPLREGLGLLTAALMLVGVIGLALPDVISGFLDEPLHSLITNPRDGVELLNGISFGGGVLLLLGVLAFVANLAVSLSRRGDDEHVADPWDGHSLEWVDDPRAVTVTSEAPLLDARDGAEV